MLFPEDNLAVPVGDRLKRARLYALRGLGFVHQVLFVDRGALDLDTVPLAFGARRIEGAPKPVVFLYRGVGIVNVVIVVEVVHHNVVRADLPVVDTADGLAGADRGKNDAIF